jgi:hypothetical protein
MGVVMAAAPAKKAINISLEKKEIRELSSSGLILSFVLDVASTARSTYSLIEYDYRVVVEGADYFALRTGLDSPIPVESGKTTRISLPIGVTYADLLERAPAVAGLPKASCYVTGLMVFADSRGRQEKIPFAFSGDFPIFKELEVEVKPLDVKTLTIGGTEFTLSVALRNGNSFELTLGRLAYKFEAEGRTIAEGVISGPKKVESQGQVIFSQPLMLDFFEVGREIFDIFQKPQAAFLFSGDYRFDCVWGDFQMEFAEKGELPINRAE